MLHTTVRTPCGAPREHGQSADTSRPRSAGRVGPGPAWLAWYDARMSEQRFDAVGIAAGPGGYPAAIRLGQLKVKTAIIEREYMGGVCLNVGCIPSKAVIHAAKMYENLGHTEDIGITIQGKPTLDVAKMQQWKSGVVNKLTSGVRTLLKGNGVTIIEGSATL